MLEQTLRTSLLWKFHIKENFAYNHSSDIDFKDFMKMYKKYTVEKYSFLVNDKTIMIVSIFHKL